MPRWVEMLFSQTEQHLFFSHPFLFQHERTETALQALAS